MAFEIYTYADLKKVGTGEDGWNLDSDYVLMNDIDASASQTENWNETRQVYEGWQNIGTWDTPFSGTFDGQGHKIVGLYMDRRQIDNHGMFGSISGIVKNLGVVDANIKCDDYGGILTANIFYGTIQDCYSTGIINGYEDVGGLCGSNEYGTIENCYSTGTISGYDNVGGICGHNDCGTIKYCYFYGNISGDNNDIGGLCGYNYRGTIQDCYSAGSVSGNDNVGGLCGQNEIGTIQNCYSTGSVNGEDAVGGFCGENYQGKIYKSYSIGAVSGDTNVGGFCGTETQGGDYDTQDNFFDYQTAGNEVEIGATKKTTSQMKDISTYTVVGNGLTEPWDIAKRKFPYKTTWRIHSWEYPKLNWEPPRSPLITFFK